MVYRMKFLHVVWKLWLQPLSWRQIVTLQLFLGGSQHLKLAPVIISYLNSYSSMFAPTSIYSQQSIVSLCGVFFLQGNLGKLFISTTQCGQVTVIHAHAVIYASCIIALWDWSRCVPSFWSLITEIANLRRNYCKKIFRVIENNCWLRRIKKMIDVPHYRILC
jgi:hypothetical protein